MGQINKYASTRCPLFGQTTPLGLAPIEQFDMFAPVKVGTSAAPLDLATSGDIALAVYGTSARTSGDQRAGHFEYHITGNRCEGQAIRAILELDAEGGGSEEAIYAIADMNAQTYVSGKLSALRGMLTLSSAEITHGSFSAVEAEVFSNTGLDGLPNVEAAFMRMCLSGTSVATFRTGGNLLEVTGMGTASSAANIFHTTGTVSGTHGLRIVIDGVDYDILLKASTYA